jgi:RNA polymerase sigma-70 factor (ECF subfamily)
VKDGKRATKQEHALRAKLVTSLFSDSTHRVKTSCPFLAGLFVCMSRECLKEEHWLMPLSQLAIIGEPDEFVQLVQLARLGDTVAFEQLYLRRYRDIYSFMIHLVGNEDAGRDLTHDTFLKAWQELSRLRDPSRFDSWLYRIARNLAWNWLQRQRIVQWLPLPEQEDVSHPPQLSVTGFEHMVEERMLLKEALARVAPQYRECVILQVVQGMQQKTIAALLGLSRESVSKYVSRGLEQLRQVYAQPEPQKATTRQKE